jgi:beta-glucanase (GH16 family)
MITSHFSFKQTYGYWEMNAKLPKGRGMWPAFWLLSYNSWPPEVDIMENLGHDSNTYYTTVHYDGTPNNNTTDNNASSRCITYANGSNCGELPTNVMKGIDLSAGFHRYGVDVESDTIKWYFDGTLIYSTSTPPQLLNEPLYIVVNTAVGGDWAGAPDATTPLPAAMDIDYIRVYQNK